MPKLSELLKELIGYPTEREWFEFKENWFEKDQLGQYISALSNSAAIEGRKNAYFVWGVNNKTHDIVGTRFDPNCDVNNEPLKHYLSRQIEPDINFSFDEEIIEGKKVVVLTIPATKTVPASFAKERYIRVGSSKENLRKYPEKESYLFEVLRHGLPTIENTPSQYQDLTFEKLLIYYGAKGVRLNEETFKKNLGFYTNDGKYNILAQLLSDDSHFVQRVAIFAGKSKTAPLLSVREFGHQCILYTLDEVLRYGDVLNIIQADERNRIVERKEVALFENDAFREAMINAFVHNRWVDGNEPMISVFSDRIEILSRGTIPAGQTLEGFFAGESVPVNQKLSEIFLQLHISEKTGRGVPKIVEKYGKDAYEFHENTILVTIPFRWINSVGWNVEQIGGNGVISETTPNIRENQENFDEKANKFDVNTESSMKSSMKIIKLMRLNSMITAVEIASILKISKRAVDKQIQKLRETNKIRRIGPDKGGHWEILSESQE
ncbi:MAG: putative DNA binding domain-containing protein [Treponema sp.]|nr:putative DNA binding domain-containing protein [Treponema sp.]